MATSNKIHTDCIRLRNKADGSAASGLTIQLLPEGLTAPSGLITIPENAGLSGQYDFPSAIVDGTYDLYINGVVAQLNGETQKVHVRRGDNIDDIGNLSEDGTGKIQGGYVPLQTYYHPRGDSEYAGNSQYSQYGMGLWQRLETPKAFTAIQCKVWGGSDSVIECRVYKLDHEWDVSGSSADSKIPETDLTLLEQVDFAAGEFNSVADSLLQINLTQYYRLSAGEYLYVLFKRVSGTSPIVRTWNTAAGASPEREYVVFCVTTGVWTDVWNQGSLPTYGQTPLILLTGDLTDTQKGYLRNISSDVQSQLDAKFTIPDSGEVKTAYFPEDVWEHQRGASEYVGDSNYGFNCMGTYHVIDEACVFRIIETKVYQTESASVEVRIYRNTTGTPFRDFSTSLPSGVTLLKTLNFAAGEFNLEADTLFEMDLGAHFKVDADDIIQLFYVPASGAMAIRKWSSYAGASPERHRFYITNDPSPWTDLWSQTSEPAYLSTPIYLKNPSVGAAIATAQSAVDAAAAKQEPFSPRMALPAIIPVAVDRELNFWWDALINFRGIGAFDFHATGPGDNMERSYRYTPASTGSNALQIDVMDYNGQIIQSKTTTLQAVSKTAGSGTKQILFIGDSLTDAGLTPAEVRSLIVADGGFTPTLLGTRGTAPNEHEGRGGWTFANYVDSDKAGDPNPFWDSANSRLDFQRYMSTSGFSGDIDFYVIQLGINDCFTYGTLHSQAATDAIMDDAKTLIDAALSASYGYPSAKVILCMPPISCNTRDGFADDYEDAAKYRIYERNMRQLWETIIAEFDQSAHSANVYVCSGGMWVDRYYGYPMASAAVSARTSTTVSRHNNAVHPSPDGYDQIADAVYSMLRYLV